jgi:hypothetical protein
MRILTTLLFIGMAATARAEEGLLVANGMGTVDPKAYSSAVQGRMMAERAAQVDGQRQLAESIRGVELTGGTTVEEFEVTSDVVATRVRGLLQGAFILERSVSEEQGSIIAEVRMAICLDRRPAVCEGRPTLQEVIPQPE